MTSKVESNPSPKLPNFPSSERTPSFGWMDTALIVSGTLVCGGFFGPACGLIYALAYLGGKQVDERFNPPPKADLCKSIPQPLSVKERKVISLLEEAEVQTQKTDAAARQLKPASFEPAPSKSRLQEEAASQKLSVPATPNPQKLSSSLFSEVQIQKENVETQKSEAVSLQSLPKEEADAKTAPLASVKPNPQTPLSVLSIEKLDLAANVSKKLPLAPEALPFASLDKTAERILLPPAAKEPLHDAKPKSSTAEASRIRLPQAPSTVTNPLGSSSMPLSFPLAPAPVTTPARNGGKASLVASQKPQPVKTNWFESLFGGKKVPGRPPGIRNQGNTCFAASVFHFIADNPVFANHLVDLLPGESKNFFQKWLPVYQKEKAEGKEQSSVPIQEMRRLLIGSGGQIRGHGQEDAHDLLMGILGSALIQLDSDPTISLETHQEVYAALLRNPLLRIKTERKTFFVGKEPSLEGSNLVRYESNPEYAYSIKRSIEIPVLDVQFMRDEKGGIVSLPLPLMLEQNWFYDRASLSDEPYKLKNNCLALPVCTEISFDKSPEVLIVALARFQGAQKIQTPVEVPLKMTLPLNGTANREVAEYELRGTVIHNGTTLQGGHYISEGISMEPTGNPQIWSASDRDVQSINRATFANHAAHSYFQLYVKETLPA